MNNKLKKILKPWGEIVDFINDNFEYIEYLNNLAISGHFEDDKDFVELIVALLENNNILFHKEADYNTYQKLAGTLKDILFNQNIVISPIVKAKAYTSSVYADYFFKDRILLYNFEQKLIESLEFLKSNESAINERFLANINVSQFYLFQGMLDNAINYLEDAKSMLNYIEIKNYSALFWYHYSWIFVEKGDYETAYENVSQFFVKFSVNDVSRGIYLHALNIRASIEFRLGYKEDGYQHAKECYNLAIKFYNDRDKDVIAENLVTMSRYYKELKELDKAEKTISKAIISFKKIFGSGELDPSQAAAHNLLGEIYIDQNQYLKAKKQFKFSEKIYRKLYKLNFNEMKESRELMSNLKLIENLESKNLEVSE